MEQTVRYQRVYDLFAATEQPSNDELLYDPDLDDVDQHWVDQQRQKYQVKDSRKQAKNKAASTDAVLCCPACMVVLCRDCQR